MPFITWSPILAVNVKMIDSQHMRLIQMINDLHDAMLAGKGKEAVGKVLNELIQYTRSHFTAEENMMIKHRYGEYARHKAEHEALIRKVGDYVSKYEAGKAGLIFELNTFLKDWLTGHIMGTDKRLGPYLNSQSVS